MPNSRHEENDPINVTTQGSGSVDVLGDTRQELLEKLRNPDRDIRQAAALALGTRSDESTVQTLAESLWQEPDFFVRETMTWALARVQDAALPVVVQALLESRISEVRTQALHVLSKFRDPSTVEVIGTLIEDPDEEVAHKARWALARIGEPQAFPPLVALMGGDDETQRNKLTDNLAEFGAVAVPSMVEALSSSDAMVRRHAADVLCFIGSPDAEIAAPALGEAVDDDDPAVAVAALMALGELDGAEAQQQIVEAGDSTDPRIRRVAEKLLAARRRRALKDRLRNVRSAH